MEKKFNNRPNTCIKQDGKEYWLSRSCSVNGLVAAFVEGYYTDVFILVVKRGKGAPDNVGKYCLPCGYLDYDETGFDAFLREVYEETGLDIINYELTCDVNIIQDEVQPFYVNSRTSNNRQNVAMYYHYVFKTDNLPETSLEFNEPDEIEEAIWIKKSDVDNYDFCFGHNDIIKNFSFIKHK